jgi:hypothetical protein
MLFGIQQKDVKKRPPKGKYLPTFKPHIPHHGQGEKEIGIERRRIGYKTPFLARKMKMRETLSVASKLKLAILRSPVGSAPP